MPSATDVAAERAALVRTLRAVGPDAPTAAGDWTARDLAAHVVAAEQQRGIPTFLGRSVVARYGVRANDTFRSAMALDVRRFRRHGFDWALARLETDPPALLDRASVLPVTLFEVFVHHEDVRRPNGVPRDIPVPDLVPSIEWVLGYHRRPLGRIGLRVVLPDGQNLAGGGDDVAVTVQGEPEEVVLWLAGRRDLADATVDGKPDDVAALSGRLVV